MSRNNLPKKSSYDDFTKDPDTLSVHQQDNDDRFCTGGRKCARTCISSQPNDIIELSSGSEDEDERIMSNSTSPVSGSTTAAAKLVSTSLDSKQDPHDFAGDMSCSHMSMSRTTSRSGGMTSGRSGHTRTSSMSGVASATATSSSVTLVHGSVEDHEQERSSAGDMCSRMSTSRTTSPCSLSIALAMKLAHGHSQQYVSIVDTAKDLEIATGMAKNNQHDILAKLSSKSTRKRSLHHSTKKVAARTATKSAESTPSGLKRKRGNTNDDTSNKKKKKKEETGTTDKSKYDSYRSLPLADLVERLCTNMKSDEPIDYDLATVIREQYSNITDGQFEKLKEASIMALDTAHSAGELHEIPDIGVNAFKARIRDATPGQPLHVLQLLSPVHRYRNGKWFFVSYAAGETLPEDFDVMSVPTSAFMHVLTKSLNPSTFLTGDCRWDPSANPEKDEDYGCEVEEGAALAKVYNIIAVFNYATGGNMSFYNLGGVSTMINERLAKKLDGRFFHYILFRGFHVSLASYRCKAWTFDEAVTKMTGLVHKVTTKLGIPGVLDEFVKHTRFPMIVDLNRKKEFKMRWKNAKRERWWQKARQEYFDSQWEAKYQQLVEYKNQHGHVNVPQDHCFLGHWVKNQRQGQGMTNERRSRLDDLDFFVWNKWEAKYLLLVEYKNQHGHVNVPQDHCFLGHWVKNQRSSQEMTPERRSRLDDLDFVWNADEAKWEAKYRLLVEFHGLHSHTKVRYAPGLGAWVKNQRGKSRPAEHTDHWNKLNDLGFWGN